MKCSRRYDQVKLVRFRAPVFKGCHLDLNVWIRFAVLCHQRSQFRSDIKAGHLVAALGKGNGGLACAAADFQDAAIRR
jgi:hypothetical protein